MTRDFTRYALAAMAADLDIADAAQTMDIARHDPGDVRLILLDGQSEANDEASARRALELCGRRFPETPIVVIAGSASPALMVAALQRGAKGYIPASLGAETAIAALRLVLAGGVFLPPEVIHALRAEASPAGGVTGDADAGTFGFTRREMQVLDGLRRGKANKLIAFELDMSENTVKVHVRRIMRKLKAANRTEAAVLAQQRLTRSATAELAPPFVAAAPSRISAREKPG